MVSNSCLYECKVVHSRLEKRKTAFAYSYFMFYLDLDEIDILSKKLRLFSRNRLNVYTFRDRDHLAFNRPHVKENILKYLSEHGIMEAPERIFLLTNVATFGYNFNPVSFYFCFDKNDTPICAIPEVGNTFGELKPFFLGPETLESRQFIARMAKNFYVSPFIDHDVAFDFRLTIPDEKLDIRIDDFRGENKIFMTRLYGKKTPLRDSSLFFFAIKYPFVTLKVITAIHYQALKLVLKKISFFRKNEYPEKQIGVITKWKN